MATRRVEPLVPREQLSPGAPKSLFGEFDRVFNEFKTGLEDFLWRPSLLPPMAVGIEGARLSPVDIKDTGKEFVLIAELPGVKKENLEIDMAGDYVEIKARAKEEKEEKDEGYYHRERASSSWYRRVPLPEEILPDMAEAELKDGVLEIRAPKKEPSAEKKLRKVRVK